MTIVPIREDWAGRIVDGRLPLLQWLGGTEGSGVFLTERPGTTRDKAAIKLIAAEAADAENRAASWEAARGLEHPHLLRLFEHGRCQMDGAEIAYVVTEYAPEVLAEILPERALTAEETRAVLEPLVDALEYLHGKGLVHGHVKPANIMAQGEVLKLTVDHVLRTGAAGGTFAAEDDAAPEMAEGEATPAADVWSLGVTLVEMLTQQRPAWGADGAPVVAEELPKPFAGIARACLQLDPAKRCALDEVRTRLKPQEPGDAKTAEPVGAEALRRAAASAVVRGEARKSSQGSKTWIRAVGVLALVAVMAVVWFLRPHATGKSLASENPELTVPADSSPSAAAQPETVKSVIAERVPPEVLQSALETIRGTLVVQVRVTVGPNGQVADATFADHGPSRYFANASMKAAQQWRFRPAEVNGQAVSSVWLLRFAYTNEGDVVTATEVSP